MSRKTPGFATRGSFREFLEEGVKGSGKFNRVDADIFHCAGVNMIAGQNVVVPAGAQQALRRL